MEANVRLVNRAKTTKLATEMNRQYYDELRRAPEEGKLVAWTTGPAPFELLRTMDVAFMHGESYGAYAAANKGNIELKQTAEDADFSYDCCSYWRTTGGLAVKMSQGLPIREDMRLPMPNFVVAANSCQTMGLWVDSLGRQLGVPSFVVDVPLTWNDADFKRNVAYVKGQLEAFIAFLEQITGQGFDYDRLEAIVRLVKEAARLRWQCMQAMRNKPAPMTFFDVLLSLGPIHTRRGTPESVAYFEKLKAEVDEKVSQEFAAVPGERHRLYWDHLPIWFKLGELSEKLASFGATLLCSFYTNHSFYYRWQDVDPERPLDAIAEELVWAIRPQDVKYRIERIVEWVDEFSLDGLVIHSSRTCRPFDIGQFDLAAHIERRLGIPSVIIDGDPTDPNYYSDEQTNARIEAFAEKLDRRS